MSVDGPAGQPFRTIMDVARGILEPAGGVDAFRASSLRSLVADAASLEAMIRRGNPLVYSVTTSRVPRGAGEIGFAVTSIEPGRVGSEFFMTRGHVHQRPEGEVYVRLSGAGGVVLRRGSVTRWVELSDSCVLSIPPGWAHRAVNVAAEPFRFLAVYPADLVNDYRAVEAAGMGARIVAARVGYRVVAADGLDLAGPSGSRTRPAGFVEFHAPPRRRNRP